MSVLLRAADLVKRPVVTLAGDDVAFIKDVVYSSRNGELAGFTLNGRGIFAGPMRRTLPWDNVHGLGPDAVMIQDENAFADRKALKGQTEGAGGAVLGSAVITAGGRNLGTVTDVILSVDANVSDAVGYEIDPADDAAPRRQFVPLPDTLSVSGEALMVPDAVVNFIRDDLAGFGAAVDEFRRQLHQQAADGDQSFSSQPPAGQSTPDDPRPSDPRPTEPRPTEPLAQAEPPAAVTETPPSTRPSTPPSTPPRTGTATDPEPPR